MPHLRLLREYLCSFPGGILRVSFQASSLLSPLASSPASFARCLWQWCGIRTREKEMYNFALQLSIGEA